MTRLLLFSSAVWIACSCVRPPPATAADPVPPTGAVHRVEAKQFLQYGVATHIDAPPEQVWALLTDAPGYPKWNSTVVSIDGRIEEGQQIALVARVDPDRTFDLEVSGVEAPHAMVWSDGNKAFSGTRTFHLEPAGDGTEFTMKEALAGWMLPMIKGKLPDFGPDFEQFAADLRRAAEDAG